MFSIIIPLYNKADYIAETLKSVLNQTYCDYEVIVVNDSSTDNSLEVASSFQDERIHIYTKENEGVSAARNYGIMHAKYDYIAFLDADDIWESDYLECQKKLIGTYPDAGIYSTAFYSLEKGKRKLRNVLINEHIHFLVHDYFKESLMAGKTLDILYAEHRELFGNRQEPVFPLLTKILDANDWLSVQVHPDDAYGLEHEGELGKTECWYIIAAEPGAEIIYGHNAKSKEELRQQIESKDWENLLTKVPVKAGDFFYVPSGTMHAIGAGIMVLETQQSSDTTYRVYDFDRKDDQGNLRELHLEKSIDVLNIGEPANSRPVTTKVDDLKSTLLVASDFFAVYKWEISGKADFEKTADYSLFSVLDGQGSLLVDDQEYQIAKGSHFILPSDVETWQIKGELELIVSHP